MWDRVDKFWARWGFMACLFGVVFPLSALQAAPIASHGITDRGAVRDHNEDAYTILTERGVWCVADGMGGHAAGEVASAIAVESIQRFVMGHPWQWTFHWNHLRTPTILAAYDWANFSMLKSASQNPSQRGMGTTMVCLLQHDAQTVDVVNVGDSRAYRLRGSRIEQISHDQSLVQEMIDSGRLKTQQEIDQFPYKNIITQAMGTQSKIVPVVTREKIEPGDVYLLCSDGLTNELTDSEIERLIRGETNQEKSLTTLVNQANKNGGRDNITAVLVAF